MKRIVGIDLGTTNSLVATVDSGIPLVVADAEGRRLTPSVIHYPADGTAPWVGSKALNLRQLKPAETIYSVKRFMGRRFAEVTAEERQLPYQVAAGVDGEACIALGDRRLKPEEVSAEVLKKLRADAELFMGVEVTRAVITVPAYFNDAQRQATKRAGELAGFTVERIINEPTAAALAYGLNRLKEKSKIAVYDLGGGTFDLSILELNEGVFQVLSTHGNTRLGGDDLDARLVEHLSEQITAANGGPLAMDASARARVREAAEAAKIRLSSETETEINLPFLAGAFSFTCTLTRAKLEELCRAIVMKTREHCYRALTDAKLTPKELDQVILVGGQTRMPLVRHLVHEWFECADFEDARGNLRVGEEYHRASGPQLNTSVNPDEAVALGAAIQAEILSGGFQSLLLLDVTPLSLGIETFGGLMNVIIPRNTTIPVKAGELFTTAVDHQKDVLIRVLQGERERARDNWRLGEFTLDFEAAPRGVARVGVQFEIDADGILHVLARDTRTGNEKIVAVKSAVDVDDQRVQAMVEESVEHAFEDLAARRWVESQLKARELVAAAKSGLEQYGAELDETARQVLSAATDALEKEMNSEPAVTTNQDVERIKRLISEVDSASQTLAEIIMDKTMEALLRKRGLIS